MLSLLRTLSLGYLWRRWMMAALVVLSIALGVAAMVATRTLRRNLSEAGQNAAIPLSGLADLLVINGQAGVPLDLVQRLDPRRQTGDKRTAALSEIREVAPLVVGRAVLPDLNNRSVLLLGLDPPTGTAAGRDLANLPAGLEIKMLEGVSKADVVLAWLTGKAALVSADLANDLGLDPADTASEVAKKAAFRVRLAGKEREALAVGLVRGGDKNPLPERQVVFMLARPAADLIYPARPDYVTQINLTLEDPTKREQVGRALQEMLGPPYKVQTLEATFGTVRDVTAGLELGFAIGGIGALVVGMFLVYNVLSVSVTERRHEIGILRSVGATRRQVAGLFVSEALVLGLIGSLLGLPIGYGLARLALGPISKMLSDMLVPVETPQLTIGTATMALALLAGMATTILAALVPAMQAAREEPADVVRRLPVAHHLFYRILQFAVVALLLLAGLGFVLLRDWLPLRVGTFAGIVCILLAGLFATPLLAVLVARLLQPFFRFFLGLEGRLAVGNLSRSPGRTGLVIAALAATGALLVQTAGFIRSSESAILQWLDESVAADLFVTSGGPVTRAGEAMQMDEGLARELKDIPGIDVALPIRFHALPYRGRLVIMLALDMRAFEQASQTHSLGRNLTRYPQLREPGKVLVSQNFAALFKVKPGEKITIDGLDGPLDLEVIDTVVDYTWNRGTIIVDRAWFREKFRDSLVDIFDVYLKSPDGAPPSDSERQAVMAALTERLGQKEALFSVSRRDLRETVATQLRRIYGLAYAQQGVIGLVALLGVVSALFISVLQRRRELGLLRAVGASRRQVLRSVLAEAVLMGLVGALLGLVIGILLEWYVLDVVLLDEAGFVFGMRIPWAEAGVVFGLSVVLATVVGLWPAWQATRIRIAEAIAYE